MRGLWVLALAACGEAGTSLEASPTGTSPRPDTEETSSEEDAPRAEPGTFARQTFDHDGETRHGSNDLRH